MVEARGRHRAAILGLSGHCLVWGAGFAAMKAALAAGLGVGEMLAVRFTLGALVLGLALRLRGRPVARQALRDGALMGLALTAVFWLQADGLRFTTTSKSGFITALYVLFTPLVSLLWGNRLKGAHVLGALVAACGLALLVHDPEASFGGWNRGDTETLLCAAFCGLHIVLTGHFGRRSDGWVLAFAQVAVVAALSWGLTVLLPAAPLANGSRLGGLAGLPLLGGVSPALWAVAYQGLLATALAFLLMSVLQPHLGDTEAAVVYTLEPVFTALIALSGLVPGIRERLSPVQLLGGGVILAAMLLAELGPRWLKAGSSQG